MLSATIPAGFAGPAVKRVNARVLTGSGQTGGLCSSRIERFAEDILQVTPKILRYDISCKYVQQLVPFGREIQLVKLPGPILPRY